MTVRFTRRGPAFAGPLSITPSTVGLNEGGDAVAMRNDLAARDLRRVRNQRVEVLVGDPLRDERLRLIGLLGGLEETKRTQDAVAGLDQVVAGETRDALRRSGQATKRRLNWLEVTISATHGFGCTRSRYEAHPRPLSLIRRP